MVESCLFLGKWRAHHCKLKRLGSFRLGRHWISKDLWNAETMVRAALSRLKISLEEAS